MTYNSLNLLEKVVRNDTIVAKYTYLWDGTKLAAVNGDDCGFAYRGSFTYHLGSDDPAAEDFESVPFGGGRIVATTGNATEVRYFLTDHLGSVRVVATDKDNVLERNDYQPFGKRWNTASLPVADNRYRFSGKEDQAFVGLPFSDYGTRMYDSERMRWLTQDPLMEKYYSIGQYNYCAGNPVKFMDKDGKKLYYAAGVSQAFKDKFAETIKYMNERGSSGDIAALEASDKVYYISEGDESSFRVEERTIYWDPNTAYQTNEGIWRSPATVLAHEAGHAKHYDQDPNQTLADKKTKDKEYGDKEERKTIEGEEQRAAKKHKEIKNGAVTRRNHRAKAKRDVSNKTPYEIEKEHEQQNAALWTDNN